MLNDTERFRCPPNVAARLVDGEAIMIRLDTGRYFSAEGVAASLWQLADSGVPFGDIVARVANRFGVLVDRARDDAGRFIEELVREGLLEPDGAGTTTADVAELPDIAYSAPVLHAYHDMADLLALDPPLPSLKPTG
jgi:hypothetical protein